ncbi:MAG: metallophosphoesterase [Labilithrix sp.]|nr:metallophosphoesterase [Labilithrix sp.]MCW5811685.1 metallophosphoesterase [Labilithrix sp.]
MTRPKRERLSRFRKILLAITAATHLPFVVAASELARRLGAPLGAAIAIGGALGALGVWVFNGRAEKIAWDAPRPFGPILLFDLPYYVHWSACIFCLVPSVLYLLASPLFGGPSASFFLGCYATGLVVCFYGVMIRRWFFVTRRVEIAVKGLDPKLDGYRIAHLSDLHIGALTPPWWAERWIDRANALAPDAVAVTGDLVTSGVLFHEAIAEVVGGLRAKDGVFCAMGNHDYFGEGEPLISLLRAKGQKVLRNEGTTIERDGARLYLTAIDDTWTRRADVDRALAGRPEGVPTVMLSHDPDRFPEMAARGVELTLAGHTHGGQIAVPFLGRWINASKLAHQFHIGLYRRGDSVLYVHPGLGTTGPPIRLGVAPAVVLLTLRAG